MAAQLNACRFTPTLGGTTDWTYASAVTGYQSPAAAGAVDGRVYKFRARSVDLTQWELCEGAYNSGTGVFARTTVLYNSSGTGTGVGQTGAGTKIVFGSVPQVAIVTLKEDFLSIEEANSFTPRQQAQARGNLAISGQPQGRLTVTPGTAITTADIAVATSIAYTPSAGEQAWAYDGTIDRFYVFPELTLPLDSNPLHTGYHQSGKFFDVFGYASAGALAIGSGPAWSSGVLRGTGAGTTELEFYKGLWRNKNQITLRFGMALGDIVVIPARQATYFGSFGTTADGVTADTAAKHFLFNAYNPADRILFVTDPGPSHTRTIGDDDVWHQANNNPANKVEILLGLPGISVQADGIEFASGSSATVRNVLVGLGLDRTNGNDAWAALNQVATTTGIKECRGEYKGCPGLGYHYLALVENCHSLGDTITFWDSSLGLWTPGVRGSYLG